jgi:hypothetical protein
MLCVGVVLCVQGVEYSSACWRKRQVRHQRSPTQAESLADTQEETGCLSFVVVASEAGFGVARHRTWTFFHYCCCCYWCALASVR